MIREMIASIQPPKKPASMPEQATDEHDADRGADRDHQRRPRAVDGVRVVVAAEHVEAEDVLGAGALTASVRSLQSRGSCDVHSTGRAAIDRR